MKKQFCILCSALFLNLAIAEEKDILYATLSNEVLIQENNTICDTKAHNSPLSLIKTLLACESVGRFTDTLDLYFLTTAQHDHLINSESQQDLLKNLKTFRKISRNYTERQEESYKVNLQLFQLKELLKKKESLGQLITEEEQQSLKQLSDKKAELYKKVIIPSEYISLKDIVVDVDTMTKFDAPYLIKEIKGGMAEVSSPSSKQPRVFAIVEIDGEFYIVIIPVL